MVDRGVVGDARAERVPRAALDREFVAHHEDAAVVVVPHRHVMHLVARMGGAKEMLVPVLDPAHRATEPAREERDQQILGVDMSLDPEPAADIERDAAHPRLRHPQHMRRLAADPVHDLGRRPDRHRVAAAVVLGDDPAAFHRHRGVTVVDELPLEPARRGGKRPGDIALRDRELADQIGAEVIVQDRRPGSDRLLDIDGGGQGIEIDRHELSRVLGGVAAVGDDDGESLADKPHLVMREQRLRRVEEFVLDRRRPFARQRKLRVGGRRHLRHQLGAVHRQHNARRRRGLAYIDAADRPMRERAADKGDMQHPRQFEIGGKAAFAGQQPPVLAPQHRAADPGRVDFIRRGRLHGARIFAAAAATALTMLL